MTRARTPVSLRAFAASAAFVLLATLAAGPRMTREMPDFEVYWRAAVRAASAEPLYRTEDQHYQFKYLPAFAVLTTPLAWVPLQTAKSIWFATSVALAILLISLSIRLPVDRRYPRWLLAAAVVVVIGKFLGHEMVLGQVNLLFGCLAVGGLLMLRRDREAVAGGLVALAVVVKPYAVIFLPWLAAAGRWRAAGAATAALVAALMVPILSYGPRAAVALHGDWWITVTSSTAPNLLNQDNVSLAAMWARWIGPGPAAARLATASAIVLLGVAAVVVWRRGPAADRPRFPEGLEGALLLTLIPLLSPQGWDYVFLIATPAVVYLVNYRDSLPAALRLLTMASLLTIGLSLFDVMGRANYATFMRWSIISVCFLIAVAGLAVLRVRRVA